MIPLGNFLKSSLFGYKNLGYKGGEIWGPSDFLTTEFYCTLIVHDLLSLVITYTLESLRNEFVALYL